MSESQRIDKWLWHARVVKTRTLAAGLVTGGHVRVNRARVSKPSQTVGPGDVITVGINNRVVVLRIEGIGDRRGPASEAATLYSDLSPPPPEKGPCAPVSRDPGAGRPTKRERRRLDAWKGDLKAPDEEEI